MANINEKRLKSIIITIFKGIHVAYTYTLTSINFVKLRKMNK